MQKGEAMKAYRGQKPTPYKVPGFGFLKGAFQPKLDVHRIVLQFLQTHPEYEEDVLYKFLDGEPHLVLSAQATAAFATWVLKTGRSNDPAKAQRFAAWLHQEITEGNYGKRATELGLEPKTA